MPAKGPTDKELKDAAARFYATVLEQPHLLRPALTRRKTEAERAAEREGR